MKPLIFTVCNRAYRNQFGDAFKASAERTNNDVRLFVVSDRPAGEYLTLRAIILRRLIWKYGSAMWMDIDSIFQREVILPDDCEIGLYLRPGRELEKRVNASMFFCGSQIFADELCDRMTPNWYSDQITLWKMYEKYRKKLRFEIFDGRMLTVNGKPEAAIWSAKGKRKISGVFQEAAKRAIAGWNGGDRMAKVLSAVQQEKIDPDNLRGAARTLS